MEEQANNQFNVEFVTSALIAGGYSDNNILTAELTGLSHSNMQVWEITFQHEDEDMEIGNVYITFKFNEWIAEF